MSAQAMPDPDCEHRREFNLETRRYYCGKCGLDWEGMKSKKTLYCACFMVKGMIGNRVTWAAGQTYFHADDIADARLQFWQLESRTVSEVHIAPVVGFLANDDNADSVSA